MNHRLPCLLLVSLVTACTSADSGAGDSGKQDARCDLCSVTDSQPLAYNDRLYIAAGRTNQRWNDWNINDGSATRIGTGKFINRNSAEQSLAARAEEVLREAFVQNSYRDTEFPQVDIQTEVSELDLYELREPSIEKTAEQLSDLGFAYAPENSEGREWIYWSLRHTLDWLGTEEDQVFKAEASATFVSATTGSELAVSASLFFNRVSGEYVYVYVREGTSF